MEAAASMASEAMKEAVVRCDVMELKESVMAVAASAKEIWWYRWHGGG